MSHRDKEPTSAPTSSSSKARHKADKPNPSKTTKVSEASVEQSSGSSKATNQRQAKQQTTSSNNGSRSGSTSSAKSAFKSRPSGASNKRGSSKQQSKNNKVSESELITRKQVEKHDSSPEDAMSSQSSSKVLETNIDANNGSSFEREESDESSCLLTSESAQSETPKRHQDLPIRKNDLKLLNEQQSNSSTDSGGDKCPARPLPSEWEEHSDKLGLYYWHVSTGIIQRHRPSGSELNPSEKESVLVCHDDEEINQVTLKTSESDDDDDDDYYESGAALTLDDTSETTFVVYPLGCCEFDETQLVSATSTKTIQKCILRLCNMPTAEESVCWGLDQSQPILMKLHSDHIQFTDLKTRNLLRSQPIHTIKTWAVDDDNNFAFVIEDRTSQSSPTASGPGADPYESSLDYALLSEPQMMCYVFRSMDDDDMSCKVAAKLNEEISRYKEQLTIRMAKSTQLQQMIEPNQIRDNGDDDVDDDGATDQHFSDTEGDFECLETSNELTLPVKYIGSAQVPRPTGIDVLNVAIDKCLAEASRRAMQERSGSATPTNGEPRGGGQTDRELNSALVEAKLHVSPSSVIVENCTTNEIIVECRIRYLTFMGISRRDIRWCGFIMQDATTKAFIAHCVECHPTAAPACDAIQKSCTKMYEKVVKNTASRFRRDETTSIIPSKSKIRDTLAKTFARIKLNPIAS